MGRQNFLFRNIFIRGFTIIEIILAVTIISVMLIIAVPNLSSILQNNQVMQQAHDFISAFQLSLTEADKNDSNVTLCAKKEMSDECYNYTTSPSTELWRNGWLLFTDTNNNGTYNPESGDTLIKSQVNGHNQITITAPTSAVTVTTGNTVTRGTGDFYFSGSTCNVNSSHKISIYNTGQIVVKGGICP